VQELSTETSSVSAATRERLIEKHRYINVDHDLWYDYVYEDFTKRMEGVGISVTEMYFTGFCSQGDGACFEGMIDDTLTYLDHHHKDQYPMIRKLLEHGGEVWVSCKHSGRYYHENSTEFLVEADTLTDVLDQPTEFQEIITEQWQRQLESELDDFERAVIETWRAYMQELYRNLEETHDALTDDDAVWDTLEANDMIEEDDEDL
jgi:hypothetical protein